MSRDRKPAQESPIERNEPKASVTSAGLPRQAAPGGAAARRSGEATTLSRAEADEIMRWFGALLPNAQVVHLAEAFRCASQRLLQHRGDHAAPVIVTAALALEHYLKSLLSVDEAFPIEGLASESTYGSRTKVRADAHTHKPSVLFDLLDKSHQDEFQRIYQLKRIPGQPEHIRALLQPFDRLFVDWRYSYELLRPDPVSMKNLDLALDVAATVIASLRAQNGT